MRGEKGQKSDGHNQALLENSIKVLRKSAQSLVDRGEANDLKTALNRGVTMYLDYAEDQAKRRKTITMNGLINLMPFFHSMKEKF